MNNDYRIWVEDLGTFRSRRTKYVGPEQLMQRKRSSLQAYMDRTYGDGVKRVYIAPDSGETAPMIIRTNQYHVYDGIGRYLLTTDEDAARELVDKNEGWTLSEVK